MALIVQLGSIVNFNVPMLETVFEKIGTPYKAEQFADRLERAKFWLEQCAPDQVNRLRATRNWEVYNTLTEEEKKEIALLHDYIAKDGYSLDELNAELYAIPKAVFGTELGDKELKGIQGAFFRTVYKLLIDKERGPRLYLFLYAIEADKYVGLLDFSYPQTEAEIEADKPVEEEAAPVEEETSAAEETPAESPETEAAPETAPAEEEKKPARRGALTEAGMASIRAAVMARFTALPESGTKLQKIYKGKIYTAFVNADGSVDMDCDIEGTEQTHFNSLTHAARTITGAKNISGRKFFGCAGKRLDAAAPVEAVAEAPAAEEIESENE